MAGTKPKRAFLLADLEWLAKACRLQGKSPSVAVAIWHSYNLAGKIQPVAVGHKSLRLFGVSPRWLRRHLERFAEAGLISVEFHKGRSPRVWILGDAGQPIPRDYIGGS